MDYPFIFQNKDAAGFYQSYWKFAIPWYTNFVKFDNTIDDRDMINWLNWGSLASYKEKLPFIMIEFFIMFLIYVYYEKCQFWLLYHNAIVTLSKNTEKMLTQYQ